MREVLVVDNFFFCFLVRVLSFLNFFFSFSVFFLKVVCNKKVLIFFFVWDLIVWERDNKKVNINIGFRRELFDDGGWKISFGRGEVMRRSLKEVCNEFYC